MIGRSTSEEPRTSHETCPVSDLELFDQIPTQPRPADYEYLLHFTWNGPVCFKMKTCVVSPAEGSADFGRTQNFRRIDLLRFHALCFRKKCFCIQWKIVDKKWKVYVCVFQKYRYLRDICVQWRTICAKIDVVELKMFLFSRVWIDFDFSLFSVKTVVVVCRRDFKMPLFDYQFSVWGQKNTLSFVRYQSAKFLAQCLNCHQSEKLTCGKWMTCCVFAEYSFHKISQNMLHDEQNVQLIDYFATEARFADLCFKFR